MTKRSMTDSQKRSAPRLFDAGDVLPYVLLDSGNAQKLEQVGPWRFVRPASQAIWSPRLPKSEWEAADAVFSRTSDNEGRWKDRARKIPDEWLVDVGAVRFLVRRTGFGHLGFFPEQSDNWTRLKELISARVSNDLPCQVLNLFAYTGGSTLACAAAGAKVVHVDASKTSVAWARENAQIGGLDDRPVRWIVDDVHEFVAREMRRGNKYHGVILDPPSFGRGTKGEVWKIEEHLAPFLRELAKLLDDQWLFALLSAHSPGVTPMSLQNLLVDVLDRPDQELHFESQEMLVADKAGSCPLPSGAFSLCLRR